MRRLCVCAMMAASMIGTMAPQPAYAQNLIELLLQELSKDAQRPNRGSARGQIMDLPREYNNKNYMKRVQQALLAIDIDAGEPDGVFGSRTLEAIRTFQSRYGYVSNGALNTAQLNRLYELASLRQQQSLSGSSKSSSYKITADSLGGSGRRSISIQCQFGSTYVLYQMDRRRWRASSGAPDADFHETALNACNS